MDWRQEEALWRYSLIREPRGRAALDAGARRAGALAGGPVARAPVGRAALGRALDA